MIKLKQIKMATSQLPDTQTQPQTQSQICWTPMESQPMENIVWGRLYSRHIKLKSLGMTLRSSVYIQNWGRSYGK